MAFVSCSGVRIPPLDTQRLSSPEETPLKKQERPDRSGGLTLIPIPPCDFAYGS